MASEEDKDATAAGASAEEVSQEQEQAADQQVTENGGEKPSTPAKPGSPTEAEPTSTTEQAAQDQSEEKSGTPTQEQGAEKPATPEQAEEKPTSPKEQTEHKPASPVQDQAEDKPKSPAQEQAEEKPATPAQQQSDKPPTPAQAQEKPITPPVQTKAEEKAPTPAPATPQQPEPEKSMPVTTPSQKAKTPSFTAEQGRQETQDSMKQVVEAGAEGAQQAAIPTPPPPPRPGTSAGSGDKLVPDALNQVWTFGMNRSVPVINITDDTRKMILYVCAHTGILYDFHGNQQLLLQGHANSITCTCVSADKRWVATADVGPDNMLTVWDSFTGVPVRNIFEPHSEGIVAMAMTPDAKYLATLSAGENQVFAIWDWTVEGDCLCSVELDPSFGTQNYVLFNPEDTSQIVTNSDGQVVFYTWQGNQIEYYAPPLSDEDFNKPVGKYSQSIFLENTRRALTATSLGNLVVWDTNKTATDVSDKKAVKLVRMQERGLSVITTTDQFIVTGDVLGHVKFFDQTLKLVNWYQDFHLGPVNSLSFAYFPEFDYVPSPDHQFPPDATIRAKPFVIRDFVVGTINAIYGHVTTDGTDVTVIQKDHDSAVHALAAHPSKPRIAVGGYSGFLKVWDYEQKTVLVSRMFERGNLIRCCQYDSTGSILGIGFTNGSVRVVDALSLDDLLQEPLRFARDSITHMAFSHDAEFLATADAEYTVTVLRKDPRAEDPYVYLGRHRAHYQPIEDLMFGTQLDSNAPRLLSLGQDRVLVEYDLENSSKDDLRLLSTDRIEQSAVPFCMAWYPPVTKESFIVTANDQYKLKLYNSTTKMCRKTLLGPTYGSPIQKLAVLPATEDDAQGKRYIAYITADKVGLHSLPLDGNPHNAMALVAHPQGVGNLACSYDGRYLFTAGGTDATVHMWDINLSALEAQAKLGGKDLVPFYGLLDGGREGELFRELEEYFYYAQIRSQGVDTMDTRKVSTVIPITEIPFVMRAMGFYPSEQEIDDMLNEVKFSDYVETGQYRATIDLGDFIKLYINHRPAFGLQPDKLAWAFHTLGYDLDGMPAIDRSDLLHVLQNRGEHMTEYELAEYLTTLLGFNAEGGSSELHEFDTSTAGDLIDENLPIEVTADMFANELLGFGMYADVLNVEGENVGEGNSSGQLVA